MSHVSLRDAAMQLSSVTAVMFQETLPYASRQSQCVTDCWKTPSSTVTIGSDTPDMHHSHMALEMFANFVFHLKSFDLSLWRAVNLKVKNLLGIKY